MAKSLETIQKRVEFVENEFKKLLKEQKLVVIPEIDFPIYREVPLEVKLAVEIIRKHGAIVRLSYTDKQEKDKK